MKLVFIMQRNIKSHSFLHIAEESQKLPLLPDDTVIQLISIQQLHTAANIKHPPRVVLVLLIAKMFISNLKYCRFFSYL